MTGADPGGGGSRWEGAASRGCACPRPGPSGIGARRRVTGFAAANLTSQVTLASSVTEDSNVRYPAGSILRANRYLRTRVAVRYDTTRLLPVTVRHGTYRPAGRILKW